VADGVAFTQANGGAAFSAAGAGVLAYRLGNAGAATQLTWHDRSGKVLGSVGAPGVYRGIALSPVDKRVAVHLHQDPDGGDIWVLDQERGTSTRFTFTQSHNIAPMWSSDGRFIVFASDHEGRGVFNLYQKSASGAGNDELIQKAPKTQFPEDAARDGQSMLYGELDTKGIVDVWALPLSGERKAVPVVKTGAIEMFSKFSPDGRWVAYVSNESGRMETYVQPFPQPTGKWQISVQGGGYPRWAHSGKELFYLTDDGTVMAVDVQPDNGAFKAGTPRALFKSNAIFGDHTGSAQNIPYDVSSDDQRFLINERLAPAGGSAPITVVLNWTAALKK
jgi:Tol biopolymer transport system component